MAKVILRQEAIDDLNDIWLYTYLNWSEKHANTYYATIELVCTDISKNPKLRKKYKEISKNLYGLKTGKHIIFYQIISKDEIEIIRMLHERMDLKNKLK